jgi:hypothetical protein
MMPTVKQMSAGLFCLLLAMVSPASIAAQKESVAMKSSSTCGDTPLGQSLCMIEAVLNDVEATYTQTGGGGISGIKLIATKTYRVSISQEERVDTITYELDIKNGKAVISNRTESARTPGQ